MADAAKPDRAAERDEADERWRLWLAPTRRRAQFSVGGGMVDVVFHGSTWWSNAQAASQTNVGAEEVGHGLGPGEDLIRTRDYVDILQVEDVREGAWIGRPVLEARVVARHEDGLRCGRDGHGLIIGDADRIHIAVDLERGVILRTQAWFKGSLYRILEMSEVQFDCDFATDTFEIEPLPGRTWQPVELRRRRRRRRRRPWPRRQRP